MRTTDSERNGFCGLALSIPSLSAVLLPEDRPAYASNESAEPLPEPDLNRVHALCVFQMRDVQVKAAPILQLPLRVQDQLGVGVPAAA
jgi:hypothetical protein